MADEDIELGAEWTGQPEALVHSLVELRLMDGTAGSRSIHDWAEHQPWVSSRGARIERAKRAAAARWGVKTDDAPSMGDACSGHAPSILDTQSSNAPNPTQPNITHPNVKTPTAPPNNDIATPKLEPTRPLNDKGTSPENSPAAKKAKSPKPEKQTDTRYTPTRNLLAASFREVCSATESVPWDAHCAKELTNWLQNHNLELSAIEQLVRNVTRSENAKELLLDPALLIPHLRKYHVPLDRFGKAPQRTDNRKAAPVGVYQPTLLVPPRKVRVPLGLNRAAAEKHWNGFLSRMPEQIGQHSYDTWLKPVVPLGIGRGVLYVKVPTSEYSERILGKCGAALKEFLPDLKVEFRVATQVTHG